MKEKNERRQSSLLICYWTRVINFNEFPVKFRFVLVNFGANYLADSYLALDLIG